MSEHARSAFDTVRGTVLSAATLDPALDRFISQIPKVELHLHLEGSIRPDTLIELAARKSWLKSKVADWIAERTRECYRYHSFEAFLRAFGLISLLLEGPDDYALITTRLLEWLSEQNIRYAEVTLSVGVLLWKKQSVETVFEAIQSAASEAESRTGVRVNWIFDAVRQFGVDHVRAVLGWAKHHAEQGVVAFGIGGDEVRGPAELFVDIYREAHDAGLHVTAHAGEAAGPDSIRAAIELLRAERIGHGLTAWQDPELMAMLRDERVPLEVCPTSNVCTRLIAQIEDHPLPKFLNAGLLVTLNSDDPGMFGTSLEGEFRAAATHFKLSRQQVTQLCGDAIRASFLSADEKSKLFQELSCDKPA
jgi:adenosine deaminase/aminodeoxyfutalosine deaminase